MNAVIIAVITMLILSLSKVHVVLALLIGALVGGLSAGMGITEAIDIFADGLGANAEVALSYAMLGAFAVAISRTGLPDLMVKAALKIVGKNGETKRKSLSKVFIILVVLILASFSQNVIPVHIAIVPILIPPLLKVFNELFIDRRAMATVLTFGLKAPYILIPAGFGFMFHEIVQESMAESGLPIEMDMIPIAMLLPVAGMVFGLGVALFVTYRKPRTYENKEITDVTEKDQSHFSYDLKSVTFSLIAIIAVLIAQFVTGSMILSALIGLIILYASRSLHISHSEGLMNEGIKMMAFIGFVMIAAGGFAAVIQETGHVEPLVQTVVEWVDGSQALAALLMLIVGLIITMGIGSSFSTVPIIATLFVPLAASLGFSPMATIALIGTASALGDAGSPASDSTLGTTSGLNADGQHHHIWDTCVPTFIHFNIPLIAFGWLAAMIL
ncbi:Na+/H+ antiporter family protein [Texcoconibacillus texcoconensis]|uniref:Sodium:proton antiporter n=1 Tax=Texcoconibacillus texcoconensis TaxID=1095777 RepID=A0A840QQ68_9BACI|nr:Na+/H+ antiporter family protein [Texcoconibacillus texcoconensis]MBB5173566.1 hypothetical protein [Texcoconibacillus texcoconensis]